MPDPITTIDSESVLVAIQGALEGPASVSSDAGSVTQRSFSELIALDRYLRSVIAARSSPLRVLRRARLIPDGTVQDRGYYRPGGFNRL